MTQLSIVASPVGYSPVATPSHTTRRINRVRHKSRGRGSKRHVFRVHTEPLIRKSARDINFYTGTFILSKNAVDFKQKLR